MDAPGRARTIDRAAILAGLVAILQDMTSDWDHGFSGEIGPRTRLIADLGFQSIDVVQLVMDIEQHFQRRGLPFEEFLMKDGGYVEEIEVGAAVDFLDRHLNDSPE